MEDGTETFDAGQPSSTCRAAASERRLVLDFPGFDGENEDNDEDDWVDIKEPGTTGAGLKFQNRCSAMPRGRASWFQAGCFACSDNMTF